MTERIISKLKDRSRLMLNLEVYKPDVIKINNKIGISFLEFALDGLENYHASLGRYEYKDQYPIFNKNLFKSMVKRENTETELHNTIEIKIGQELINFYFSILSKLCKEGSNPKTYGETVYIASKSYRQIIFICNKNYIIRY